MKGVFAGRPALFQVGLLLSLILAGAILAGALSFLFADNLSENAGLIRLYQFISAIFTFLLPAVLVAYFCSDSPEDYLFMKHLPGPRALVWVVVSMFLLSPVITFTGVVNKMMKLPAFLEPVERWMQSMEAMAEELTNLLLSQSDIFSLLANLLVVAVTAAVTEEFFFRGTLQRIIGKWTSNPHVVIWVVAFLFSALHLQFYGFIPRMLLGAYFGYLLLWSGSIWLPVLAHFINNSVAVIGMSNEKWKDNKLISGEIADSDLLMFGAMAALFLVLFCYCVKRLRKELG